MAMEIDIHQSLSNAHVVGFHGFFEDKNHMYILLELCQYTSVCGREEGGKEVERGREGWREREGEGVWVVECFNVSKEKLPCY